MTVDLFCLCDFASSSGGKLNVIGVFDTINIQSIPSVHPICAIAARLRFEQSEFGIKKISFLFLDPDGEQFMTPMEGDLAVQPLEQGATESIVQIALLVSQMPMAMIGPYVIQMQIENKLVASTRLDVRKLPAHPH